MIDGGIACTRPIFFFIRRLSPIAEFGFSGVLLSEQAIASSSLCFPRGPVGMHCSMQPPHRALWPQSPADGGDSPPPPDESLSSHLAYLNHASNVHYSSQWKPTHRPPGAITCRVGVAFIMHAAPPRSGLCRSPDGGPRAMAPRMQAFVLL
jgi:hypothetical protein